MNPPTEQDKQRAAQLREAADIIEQGLEFEILDLNFPKWKAYWGTPSRHRDPLKWLVEGYDLRRAPIPDPYAELKKAHAEGKVIQFKLKNETDIESHWLGSDPLWKSTCDYRIKPPIALIPLDAGDITTAHEFRNAKGNRFAWGIIKSDGVTFSGDNCNFFYTWEELKKGWHYRAGTDEWTPCSKPAP